MNQLAFTRHRPALTFDGQRQEFLSLYPNRMQGILRPPSCKTWVTVSKHFPVGDDTIYGAIAGTESNLWGLRFAEKTRFAIFDIDKDSRYHNVQQLQELIKALANVGLTGSVYRSSESGGWHVYLFFADWEDCQEIQNTLKVWLRANKYEIRNGILEVFPSGMGLRLPLQRGFAWLDSSAEIIRTRNDLTTNEAISHFLTDLSAWASNWSDCKMLIQSQLEALESTAGVDAQAHRNSIDTEGFDGLFSYRLIPEKYQDGRNYWQNGLAAVGQRHDAVLAVEHYLWHGDSSLGVPALPGEWNDEARFRLILAWLKQKHNGCCRHVNRGNWRKVEAQITRCVKWRRPSNELRVVKPYPMTERAIERLMSLSRATGRTWSPDDLKKGNEGREAKTRAKISAALERLLQNGSRIGRNELARESGCSPNSVSKHVDLWLLFASGSGDQNPFLDPIQPQGEAAGTKERLLVLDLFGDSRQTELFGQPAQAPSAKIFDLREELGSEELAPIVLTPPVSVCLATSLPANPQHQAQALRVASQALTPGPWFAGIQAEWQTMRGGSKRGRSCLVHAGRLVCYTCDIAGGIKEREGATSRVVALASFGAKSKEKKTVLDATNYRFLATDKLGYSSGILDEFSLIERPLSGMTLVDRRGCSCLGSLLGVFLYQTAANTPESTSACLRGRIRVYECCDGLHACKVGARPTCRQLLDEPLEIPSDGDVRGPPFC